MTNVLARLIAIALLTLCLSAQGQTMSYWAQGFNRQGNAKLAQEYFFVPGLGIYFTYPATNRVVINSTTGGGTNTGNFIPSTGGSGTNLTTFGYLNAMGPVRMLGCDNEIICYSQMPSLLFQGHDALFNNVNASIFYDPTNDVFIAESPMTGSFIGDGSGLLNVPCNCTNIGLSITQSLLLVSGGFTNLYTNLYVGGILMASGPSGAGHGSSIILPGGGYLLQPGGGSILLP